MSGLPDRNGITIAAALADATRELVAAGVEQPRLDARLLLGHALETPRDRLYGKETATIPAAQHRAFLRLVARRAEREPVSRIIGKREFWSLSFSVGTATLDPRPDSETMIDTVLTRFPDLSAPLRVLDLGTGSGCLLLAVLSEYPQASGLGVDLDPCCLEIAKQNSAASGFDDRTRFQAGDWTAGLDAVYDVILCNPPYIPTRRIGGLEPEVVMYDPVRALDGGSDGLDCYRDLSGGLTAAMAVNSLVFLEIGAGQADMVIRILADAGLCCLEVRKDLGGRPRCLVIGRNRRS